MARDLIKENIDKQGEKSVHYFLNDFFYKNVSNYVECNDRDTQLKGIDTKFTFNGLDYLCDEKAALDYTNMQKGYKLNTFCLELSFLNRHNDEMEGWLTNKNMENNSYLLVWIDKSEQNIVHSSDEILEAEIMLVWKNDILNYLNDLGWTSEKLRLKSHNIRYEGDRNFGNYNENGCKLSYATYLPERPINILLTRHTYENMPRTIKLNYKRQ